MSQTSTLYTLAELAATYQWQAVGATDLTVDRLVHPRLANEPTDLIYAPSIEALAALKNGPARCALVGQDLAIPSDLLNTAGIGLLIAPRHRVAMARLLQHFEVPAQVEPGIHPTAVVHPTARLAPDVTVGPYGVVGPDCRIEAGSVLHAHVTLGAQVVIGQQCRLMAGVRVGDRVTLGNRVIVQSNAVIAADGFSYVTEQESRHEGASDSVADVVQPQIRIPSIGTVVLEDDVEIGACTCIDRGTLAETRIGRGTKIDNLVQVGHNNRVGQHCLIVSQAGLAGSCKLEDGVVLAGQAGLADHLTIGERAIVMAKSGVMRDVEAGTVVGGTPAMPRKQILETLLYTTRLKEMNKELKSLSRQVQALQKQLSQEAPVA